MDTQAELQQRTARLRQGTLRIRTRPNATVRVEQLGHGFEFGTPLSGRRCRQEPALGAFTARWFNAGVVPVKWRRLEPERGKRRYDAADATVDWCEENGFALRGHCLFYAHRIHVQDWVRAIESDEELLSCMERQARETVGRYGRRICEYDLNNELLDGSWYRDRLGDEILRRMADWVLEENPEATLYVNEHDILTGGDIEPYVDLIDHLLSIGVPIGGIGVQGHLDPPFELGRMEDALDRLAAFGLPVKVTEVDCGIKLKDERYRGVGWIEGADRDKDPEKFQKLLDNLPEDFEEQKAEALDRFYRRAFAHPAIRGIYMWGFQEGRHWRTRGEIFRSDLTPLPAGEAYCNLVRGEWWTTEAVRADDEGFASLRAFYGTHRITVEENSIEVELHPDNESRLIELADNG